MRRFRGVYLVGIKSRGWIADVAVEDGEGQRARLPLEEYLRRRLAPPCESLPWLEDVRDDEAWESL